MTTAHGRDWNEASLSEDPAIVLLEKLGYQYVAPEVLEAERASLKEVFLLRRLTAALQRLNPWLTPENATRAARDLTGVRASSLIEASERMHTLLAHGVSVDQDRGAGKKGQQVRFFDFDDLDWLGGLDDKLAHEVIIELQPVLTRQEFELVSGSVRDLLVGREGEEVFAAGRDLSGRRWLRARLRRATIKKLGAGLISIQSIHTPLRSVAFAASVHGQGQRPADPARSVPAELPAVAVLDGGVPRDHVALAAYRRGEYRHPEVEHSDGGDHGSRVGVALTMTSMFGADQRFVGRATTLASRVISTLYVAASIAHA